jgi:hypothetical protein
MMLSNLKLRTARVASAAALLLASMGLGGASLAGAGGVTMFAATRTAEAALIQNEDVLIFRNGQQVQGTILEETPTTIRMRVNVAGIAAETTYNKSDILSVTRGKGAEATGDRAPEARPENRPEQRSVATPGDPNRKKVYVIELTGRFGKDISETPMRQAMRDALRMEADHIIWVLDNDWSDPASRGLVERKEDETDFMGLWRAKDMRPILVEEIPREWRQAGLEPPTQVFWVKQAMGGAAFLPFNSTQIYFHPDARMGGIGHLARYFGGDEVVRQKMMAASLSAVEGMALTGGYDPHLVRAMVLTEYVLSVRFSGGQVIYRNTMDLEPGDLLLTDDGQDDRKDTIQELARGEGNDVLTLKPDIALKLGVSRGTVSSLDQLMFEMRIARNHQILAGRSQQIMRQWRDGVDDAARQLPRMWRNYQEIQVGGDRRERQQARSRQISTIQDMIRLMRRWEEALNPREVGVPTREQLEILEQQIRMEQLADRR